MSRKYQHIIYYETEIINMINRGHTLREIGNKLGFTYNEIQNLKTRYNKKQIIVEAGKTLKKKDDRVKNGDIPPSIEKLDKLAQIRYVLASKERYIKRLEPEVELMRDFLSLTGKKLSRQSNIRSYTNTGINTVSAKCADSSKYQGADITNI